MSVYIDIFVGTTQPLDEFVQDLGRLLPFSLTREAEGENPTDIVYTFEDEGKSIWVYEHDYAKDLGLPFEDYRYAIGIEVPYTTAEETEKRLSALAHKLFEILCATRHYHLLMVRNLQRRLDQFDP